MLLKLMIRLDQALSDQLTISHNKLPCWQRCLRWISYSSSLMEQSIWVFKQLHCRCTKCQEIKKLIGKIGNIMWFTFFLMVVWIRWNFQSRIDWKLWIWKSKQLKWFCQLYSNLVKAWKSCISPGLHTNVVGIS